MKISELRFEYPENLVAIEPKYPSRVMWHDSQGPEELTLEELIDRIPAGDILVLNDTKVLKRRVFAGELEILFLTSNAERTEWQVLFPSRAYKIGDTIELPLGEKIELVAKGRPQTVRSKQPLAESYFAKVAEIPLPPYIQKARGTRHTVQQDEFWYQTAWAKNDGSLAAPTASLHFRERELAQLHKNGVEIYTLTLHVGLGTFLPVTAENLDQHQMHEEFFEISESTWTKIQQAKRQGRKVWALGTTATRALESAAQMGKLSGFTDLLLKPGSEFHVVDRLLTNFHQPESTLLALVYAFAGQEAVMAAYRWAIEKKFRLFSYGDLSVWLPRKK